MKHTHSPSFVVKPLLVALAYALAHSAFALPVAPDVVSGSASFNQSANQLIINNSNGAIINWGSFSIAGNEVVRFNQPSSSSRVLNRVIGNDPSLILGALQSNGRVFLINPAGILVGQGARIDVAGFVASTLHLSNEDFQAGRMNFQPVQGAGSIRNGGVIATPEGGQVYLVAPQIENNGLITTPKGEVVLAAGQHVEIGDTANPGVRIGVGSDVGEINNLGQIVADAGQIGLVGALIKNSGQISADSAISDGGKIVLRASQNITQSASGQISANGRQGGSITIDAGDTAMLEGQISAQGFAGNGGRIEVVGDKVGILGAAQVNASAHGQGDGGTVLIGGDYQGANAAVRNAHVTAFAPDAVIKADAGEIGQGGKVILWADDTTKAYGAISVRGGNQSGDGGFVEVSGKRVLDFQAKEIDRRAVLGNVGVLLLDPTNITIGNSSAIGNDWTNQIFTPSANTSTNLSWADINAQLLLGNVVVQTKSNGAGVGSITINAGTTLTGTNRLSLLAEGSILSNVSSNTTIRSQGDILMVAGWDNTSGIVNPTLQAGYTGDSGVATNKDGSIVFSKLNLVSAGSIDLRSRSVIRIDTGTIQTTQGGDISLRAGFYSTVANSAIWLGNGGGVTFDTSNSISGGTAGNITLTAENGRIRVDTGNQFISNGGSGTATQAAGNGGQIKLIASTDVRLNGTVGFTANGGQASTQNGGNGGQVLLQAGQVIPLAASANVSIAVAGGNGTHGGAAGNVSLVSTTATLGSGSVLNVNARGGTSSSMQTGGAGGTVNWLNQGTYFTGAVATIDTTGGLGANDGAAGFVLVNTQGGNLTLAKSGNIASALNIKAANASLQGSAIAVTGSSLGNDLGNLAATTGTINLTNAHINANGLIALNTVGDIVLSNSQINSTAGAVQLKMSDANAVLNLMQSQVISGAADITLNYLGRTSGGLVVDGVAVDPISYMTNASYGASGFYSDYSGSTPTPINPGASGSLGITYPDSLLPSLPLLPLLPSLPSSLVLPPRVVKPAVSLDGVAKSNNLLINMLSLVGQSDSDSSLERTPSSANDTLQECL